MSFFDSLAVDSNPWIIPLASLLALLVAWLVYRYVRRSRNTLKRVLEEISVERYRGLIIPGAHEGEIQIDELMLTANGLLILEIKNVQGVVFGSDKMQDWTVMSDSRRYTIPNPQPPMFDRIAAVRDIVRQVPVTGRILFLDGAEFTKGVPSLVCDLKQLADEFGEPDKS
ncbi:MAG: NERD domain-containing protein, partial [Gammaproteobacteria bacterium]|nr:NERD domain-containing protein [Gammaproteobacteria bacterium]